MPIIEEARKEFYFAREGLKNIYTLEDLKSQSKKVEEAEKRLLEIDHDFRSIIEERKREAKMRIDKIRVECKAREFEAKKRTHSFQKTITRIRMDIMAEYRDNRIYECFQNHRINIQNPEEIEKQISEKLWCPICQKKDDSNNILNGVPTCFKHWHKLVQKSELKNYNRRYRRNWKNGGYKS